VVIDNMMTASARFADILLPATSSFEESDLCYQSYGMELGTLIMRQKAIEPIGECRTLFDICARVTERMGVRWRRVVEFAGGDWVRRADGTFSQDVFAYYISVSCNHCQDPVCVQTCPSTAMNQDPHGIVTVDPQKCLGYRYCEWACPYSAPQFDEAQGQMTKCDFCREELEQGGVPSCVAGCPTRALQFGEYDQLAARHGCGRVSP